MRLSTSTSLAFHDVSRASLFMLVLGGEGSSWNLMKWVCDLMMQSLQTRTEKSYSHSNLNPLFPHVLPLDL